jgi:hypothetical protein
LGSFAQRIFPRAALSPIRPGLLPQALKFASPIHQKTRKPSKEPKRGRSGRAEADALGFNYSEQVP